MLGAAAAYLVAISAMLFAGFSALVLFHTVRHFDPPEAASSPAHIRAEEEVAV